MTRKKRPGSCNLSGSVEVVGDRIGISFVQKVTAAVLFLIVGVVSYADLIPPVQAADDSGYLDALEAEAGNVAAAGIGGQGAATAKEPAQMSGELPPDLDMAGFEESLRKQLFGSYLFYKNLSDTNKRAVYAEYQKTRRIEDIRNKITSLFAGS